MSTFFDDSGSPVECRDTFDLLARDDPSRLAVWLISEAAKLSPAHVAYAAEALGREASGDELRPRLVVLLELYRLATTRTCRSPLIREGVVCGLAFHKCGAEVRRLLREIASTDESPGVREAADEALQG